MTRTKTIRPQFVEFIPGNLEEGILYVSDKYKTASHLCCCGCGNKVVTPLKPAGWQLKRAQGRISLFPSIGSWSLPCRSHYWIRGNSIVWAPVWTPEEIAEGRFRDQEARERYFDRQPIGFWQKLWRLLGRN